MLKREHPLYEELREVLREYHTDVGDAQPVVVGSLEVYCDPYILGVYAVQANIDGLVSQFLVTRNPRTGYKATPTDEPPWTVDEVEFSTWPPTARGA